MEREREREVVHVQRTVSPVEDEPLLQQDIDSLYTQSHDKSRRNF